MSALHTAFYRFARLSENALSELRTTLYARAKELELKGTILLSTEGINGFLAGASEGIEAFKKALEPFPSFSGMVFKDSSGDSAPFARLKVRIKKEIIPSGQEGIDPIQKTGPRILPLELKALLDENPSQLALIDTRNDYEIEHGTFCGAIRLGLKHFRDFPGKIAPLRERLQDKKIVMFCTGGIRCEKATAIADTIGIPGAYQLEGGILKYFEDAGGAHFEGNCFVFDGRVALTPNLLPISSKQ